MALITCPKCGQQISEDSKFCKHCGASINASSENQNGNEFSNEESGTKTRLIWLAIGLIAIGGAIAYYFYSAGNAVTSDGTGSEVVLGDSIAADTDDAVVDKDAWLQGVWKCPENRGQNYEGGEEVYEYYYIADGLVSKYMEYAYNVGYTSLVTIKSIADSDLKIDYENQVIIESQNAKLQKQPDSKAKDLLNDRYGQPTEKAPEWIDGVWVGDSFGEYSYYLVKDGNIYETTLNNSYNLCYSQYYKDDFKTPHPYRYLSNGYQALIEAKGFTEFILDFKQQTLEYHTKYPYKPNTNRPANESPEYLDEHRYE